MSATRESGTPKATYTLPKFKSDQIRADLGTAQGFLTFLHKLSFAEKLMDRIEITVIEQEKNLLRNQFTKKPIETKLPMMNVNVSRFIWNERGYIVTRFDENEYGLPEVIEEEYWMTRPPIGQVKIFNNIERDYRQSNNIRFERVPSLKQLKPRDSLSSTEFLIRTPALVPVSLAYEFEDPIQLSKVGKMQYEWRGKVYDMFETVEDIQQSEDFTKDLGRNYYDNKIEFLYDQWYKTTLLIRVLLDQQASEMDTWQIEEDE